MIPEDISTETTTQNKVMALDPGVRIFLTGYDGETVLEMGKGDKRANREIMLSP